jgi:hypothetical protein
MNEQKPIAMAITIPIPIQNTECGSESESGSAFQQ